jgi:multidrug efflux system outer membrane protein
MPESDYRRFPSGNPQDGKHLGPARNAAGTFGAGFEPRSAAGCPGGLLIALLAAGLGACTVGPDYHRPATEVGRDYANAVHDEFAPDGIELAWWKRFDDPQLTGLIDAAVANNRDLRAATANVREARALFLQAGLDLFPTITAHGAYTAQKRSIDSLNRRNFVPRNLELFNAGFDASWEVDIFGRIRRNMESRAAEIEVSIADRHDVMVSVIAETARNYFELRGLQNELAVARRNAANQTDTLRLTEALLEAGRGTELDTSRARGQLDTTLATIPPIEAAIQRSVHRLGVLTGQLPNALAERLSQASPLPRPPELVHIGKPADLLRRRPDIRAAENVLAAATASIGVATADLFPRVTFNGNLALESRSLFGLGASNSETFLAGPRITWAAFDLGRVRARIRAADAQAEADLAQYEQTVLNALEETENALVGYDRQRARTALLVSAAAASEQAQSLAQMRFEEGVADFLTVLDAERRLLEDQLQLARSQTATATALLAVFKALGGGWEVYAEQEAGGVQGQSGAISTASGRD